LLKNLFVVAGAKVPPLLSNSSFLSTFFLPFFDFAFKLLKTRSLKTKVFSSPRLSPKERETLPKWFDCIS